MTAAAAGDRSVRTGTLRELFAERFAAPCEVVARAPGRVNLIGEHTDYNDGYALPIAIGQSTWAAAAARTDGLARVLSLTQNQELVWPLDDWRGEPRPHWTSYIAGVAAQLRSRNARLDGFDLLIQSDVPPGGGLASSAALEVATALALAHLAGEPLETREFIDLCRAAEHEFARVPCGIMDQTASLCGRQGHAILLDCRTRKVEAIALPLDGHALLVVDSGVRHELAAGEYAKRQAECRDAVAYFRGIEPAVAALRDIGSAAVQRHAQQMSPLAAARARHVTSENERTLAAAEAIRTGDLREFGRLMRKSHASLRDDYEVSCRELDDLVTVIDRIDGVYGSRMTGGGFGGCVIALLRESAVAPVIAALRAEFDTKHVVAARPLRVAPGAGAAIEFG